LSEQLLDCIDDQKPVSNVKISSLFPVANFEMAKGSQSKLQPETLTNKPISIIPQLSSGNKSNNNSDDEILNFNDIALICEGQKEKGTNVERKTRMENNIHTQKESNRSKTTEKSVWLQKKRKSFQEVQQQQQISIRNEAMISSSSSSLYTSTQQKSQKSLTKSIRERKKNKKEKSSEGRKVTAPTRVSATNFRIPSTSTSSVVINSHSLWTEKYAPVDEVHPQTLLQAYTCIHFSLSSCTLSFMHRTAHSLSVIEFTDTIGASSPKSS
jgi:hypothetical protein